MLRILQRLKPVKRQSVQRNHGCLSVRDNGPSQPFITEGLRYGNGKQTPLPAGEKMCRLALVWISRFDPIVRTDRNVHRLV